MDLEKRTSTYRPDLCLCTDYIHPLEVISHDTEVELTEQGRLLMEFIRRHLLKDSL